MKKSLLILCAVGLLSHGVVCGAQREEKQEPSSDGILSKLPTELVSYEIAPLVFSAEEAIVYLFEEEIMCSKVVEVLAGAIRYHTNSDMVTIGLVADSYWKRLAGLSSHLLPSGLRDHFRYIRRTPEWFFQNLNSQQKIFALNKLKKIGLTFAGVSLTKKDFEKLSSLSNLHTLKLLCCKEDSDFEWLKLCKHVKVLDLSQSDITTQELEILSKSETLQNSLEELTLDRCKGIDYSVIKHFKKLRKLRINNRKITDDMVQEIVSSNELRNSLQELDLSSCHELRDVGSLLNLENLKTLNIGYAGCKDIGCLKRMKSLRVLRFNGLRNVQWEELIKDPEWCDFQKGLDELVIGRCDNPENMKTLADCKNLKVLHLGDMNLTEQHFANLGDARETIEELKFNGRNIQNYDFLENFRSLKRLTIYEGKQEALKILADSRMLTSLEFLKCGELSDDCNFLVNFTNLEEVYLHTPSDESFTYLCQNLSRLKVILLPEGYADLKFFKYVSVKVMDMAIKKGIEIKKGY